MFLSTDFSRVQPSVWCKVRSQEWWRGVVAGLYGEEWWRENIRMTHETFDILCDELRPHLEREHTRFRRPVSVEARVAVTIWRVATNVEYRTIAALFGLGRSTVGEIVLDTCEVIAQKLMPKYVRIPCTQGLREIVDGFEQRWGFPQAVGAIDGTHIPILKPRDSPADYYNRKGFYSVLIQGLVDFRGRFMNVNIGWPGKVHDARVLANSLCYKEANAKTLFPDWVKRINNVDVPLVILGDPAYPLLTWLMKPYVYHSGMSRKENIYNYRHSRARMCVENAFGRLKGRWRCLLKRMDNSIDNVANIIATCVTLHNLCEVYGDECQAEWLMEDPLPSSSLRGTTVQSQATTTAKSIRDAIKDSF